VTTTAVIVPSARRPQNARRLARAFRSTTEDPDTYLLLAVDDDDPFLDAYRTVQRVYSEVCHLIVVKDSPHKIGPIINDVARDLLDAAVPPDFIGFMGDDHEPQTPGWDVSLVHALGGRPGVAYANDKNQGSKLPTACLISTPVVAALGYLVPPGMHHLYLDDFWLMLGHATHLAYRGETVIEHLHPTVGNAPMDEGYLAAGCNPQVFAADAERYRQYMEGGDWAAALTRLRPLCSVPGAR
jgi:hypothetical protein